MTFAVRLATVEDVNASLDLLEEVVAEGTWLGTESPFDRDERGEGIRTGMADGRFVLLVALEDGATPSRVVGHLGLEMTPYGVATFGMCVAGAWRGRGVGQALVVRAIEVARERRIHKFALQVWPHNGSAIRLYLRLGFVVEGRLVRHYRRRSGELWDAIMMGLVLDTDSPGSPHPDYVHG